MCERASHQVQHLLAFVHKDRELLEVEEDMKYLVHLKLANRYFEDLCSKKITLKDLRHLDDDLYGLVLDTVEDPNQTQYEIEELESQDLKRERKLLTREVDNFVHALLNVTLPDVVCKTHFNRLYDATPVEMLFIYDDMGHVHDRLNKHAKCISVEWERLCGYLENTIQGRCRRCGSSSVVRKSPSCKVVQFCSSRCHREDLQDKVSGHKYMEAHYMKN